MPSRCCMPKCRGNYNGTPQLSVFGFPRDPDLRRKWVNSVRRENFQVTSSSKVCEQHFSEDQILRETECYDTKNGILIKAPLKYPRLKPGAVPSILQGCPTYLSSKTNSRVSPETRREGTDMQNLKKALLASVKSEEEYSAGIKLTTLSDLHKKLVDSDSLSSEWTLVYKDETVLLLSICLLPTPHIIKSIVISMDLNLSVFISKTELKKVGSDSLPLKLHDINKLHCVVQIVEHLASNDSSNSVVECLTAVTMLVDCLKKQIPEQQFMLSFITDQLLKLKSNKFSYQYSPDILVFTSLLFSISAHAYRFLRNSGYFLLPHPNTIKRLCSAFHVNPIDERDDIFLGYIKNKFKYLTASEHFAVLLLDEIHLKPQFDYKGGNIVGKSVNSDSTANSAHVLMVQSLFSPYKDVAHILPIRTLTAAELHDFLQKIILKLEAIGFKIIAICSDNNSISRRTMSLFSDPPKLHILHKHPVDSSRPLFHIIDAVHILKSVRNNWINQKTSGQTMYFPNFVDPAVVEAAEFCTLKKLYDLENRNLVKYGYGLTLKA